MQLILVRLQRVKHLCVKSKRKKKQRKKKDRVRLEKASTWKKKSLILIPRQWNSLSRQRANRLPGSSPVKRFVTQSHAGPVDGPRANPTNAPCDPVRPSTIGSRLRSCQCTKRRPCDPGTVGQASGCEGPKRQCFRLNSSWNKPKIK